MHFIIRILEKKELVRWATTGEKKKVGDQKWLNHGTQEEAQGKPRLGKGQGLEPTVSSQIRQVSVCWFCSLNLFDSKCLAISFIDFDNDTFDFEGLLSKNRIGLDSKQKVRLTNPKWKGLIGWSRLTNNRGMGRLCGGLHTKAENGWGLEAYQLW